MHQTTIVLVDPRKALAPLIKRQRRYNIIRIDTAQHFIGTLIDRRAALIFMDATHPSWRDQALAGKTNAATRRIPLCLVSDDAQVRAEAISYGADIALSWSELPDRLPAILSELARAPDSAWLDQLACECRQALPPLALEGLRQFNRGAYYQQHDLFEEQWVKTEGPIRDLYRAILQVGVAYYQIERGNYRGALKMLQRSVQWLYLLPETCQGIDIAQLRRDSYAVRAELQRLGPTRLGELDRSLLKGLHWQSPQAPST